MWYDGSLTILIVIISKISPSRFGGLSSTTSELLAGCFLCLAASIDRSNAATVASKLLSLSSGVLPSLDRGLLKELKDENYLYYIKEARLSPGVVGTALAGIECTQGSYPLAGAFLKLITAFVQVCRTIKNDRGSFGNGIVLITGGTK